jgi:hypothetical protein
MTAIADPKVTTRRPFPVVVATILLAFLGLSAVGGSVGMIFGLEGMVPPADWLDTLPVVDGWLIPGLVLGVGFGLGSLVTAFGVWRRPVWKVLGAVERASGHHWSWLATIALGVGQIIWIGIEVVFLPELSFLQVIYGPLGLVLAALAWYRPVSEYLRCADSGDGRLN